MNDPTETDLLMTELLRGSTGGMKEQFGSLIADNDLWHSALTLTRHPDPRIAFRASWALDWAYFRDKTALLPHTDLFIETFLTATNPSVHRQFSKILYDMCHRRIVNIDDIRLARIAEKSFDLLIDIETKPAVKVWCMEILHDIAPRIDWIYEQLRETLMTLMDSAPSPGVANKAGKILRRMQARIRTR